MTKLFEVEKSLKAINESVFQNVCDAILYNVQNEYPIEVARTGSTIGKQKTKKGTPDTFFVMPNGKYVLVEYTTQEYKETKASFLKKAKADILKCLNQDVTKIKHSEIEKIIFCYNSKLSTKESQALKKLCSIVNVNLELKGIDFLSYALIGRCKHVAKEYLGITIDTGQIIPPSAFIKEYEMTGIATPLSNKMYGREQELKNLVESILEHQITIVWGGPGVGKSKLVLESLSQIQQKNRKLSIVCMSNKHTAIYDDLVAHLSDERQHIIFIDDANRQSDNIRVLLGLLKSKPKHQVHIVATVRDYALTALKRAFLDWKTADYELQKLTTEQIQQILRGEDFNIQNSEYLIRISDISNGNPRLAIMAARVALEAQDISSLKNVYDLYEQYFDGQNRDTGLFSDNLVLKTLGVLSFFYSINLENTELLKSISDNFNTSEHQLKSCLATLEEHELAESTPDNLVLKISDQVLSTYFFYKVFLRDKILSFDTLLNSYFGNFHHRFADTVLSANSTFGYENVLGEVDSSLSVFWRLICNNKVLALQFLKLFWMFRHEDIFEYAESIVNTTNEVENAFFTFSKEQKNRGFGDANEVLSLLSKCFQYRKLDYLDAVELSYDYCKRYPATFQQLQGSIIDHFNFDLRDLAKDCDRQKALLDFLIERATPGSIYEKSLLYTLPSFLSKTYRNYRSNELNDDSEAFGRINILDSCRIFRTQVWNYIITNYPIHKTWFDDMLLSYAKEGRDGVKSLYEFDFDYCKKIFATHFNKKSLSDVFIIQSLIHLWRRLKLKLPNVQALKEKYNSPAYKIYVILSRNRLRDKEDYEFTDFREYDRLKEVETRTSFHFKNLEQFKKFYAVYLDISNLKDTSHAQVPVSLDIIIDEHFKRSPKLGFQILHEIVKTGNVTKFYPLRMYQHLFSSGNIHADYYELLMHSDFESREYWFWFYHYNIPSNLITAKLAKDLLQQIKTGSSNLYLDFSVYFKYQSIKKNFVTEAFKNSLIRKEKYQGVQLDYHLFDKYLNDLSNNIDLLKKAYLLNDRDRDHFDYDCKYLLALTRLDRSFFLDYIKSVVKEESFSWHSREFDHLSIIWNLPDAATLVESAIDYILSVTRYFFSDNFANSFFKNIDDDHKMAAITFLKVFIKKHKHNRDTVNFVFDCVRNSFPVEWREFLLYYLSIESDFEAFTAIELLNSSFISSGNVIWADIRAEQLKEVLDTIETISIKKYRFKRHKDYLKEQILIEKRQADYERRLNFQHKNWH